MSYIKKLSNIANELDRDNKFELANQVDEVIKTIVAQMDPTRIEYAENIAKQDPLKYLEIGYHHQKELDKVTEGVIRRLKGKVQDESVKAKGDAWDEIFAFLNSGLAHKPTAASMDMTRYLITFLKSRGKDEIISDYKLPLELVEK